MVLKSILLLSCIGSGFALPMQGHEGRGLLPPTPEYLNVPHFKECLGHLKIGQSVHFCMPSKIANGCPVDSYNKLKDVFNGPDCVEQVQPPTPEYLNVPHFRECLGHMTIGQSVHFCMPSNIANGCPVDSYNKLKDVFNGPDCVEPVQVQPPTPEYLKVPHFRECLGHMTIGQSVHFCMPSKIANGCPVDSYNKLKDVFNGPDCVEPVQVQPPTPEYLNVPHFKECLGHMKIGQSVHFCMPSKIANGCPVDSYNKLKDVFNGPDCVDQLMTPTPEYLNVPHFKDCLGLMKIGQSVHYCMPSTLANGCPIESYNKLKEVFDGVDC